MSNLIEYVNNHCLDNKDIATLTEEIASSYIDSDGNGRSSTETRLYAYMAINEFGSLIYPNQP